MRDPRSDCAARLLDWYDRNAREMPWRIGPADRRRGIRPDPYRVWLSEVMLQQTTVAAVDARFRRFVARWPDVAALAGAADADVMAEWAGLGYYARARNLHACAQAVSRELGGVFPSDLEGLRALPGIGDYTANAIRAAAFDLPASVVDANVERVISRVFTVETPLPAAKREITEHAAELADPDRPGDYAQAIMDLGAVICTPRGPACGVCVWAANCKARKAGTQERYPVKAAKKVKPVRHGLAFVILREGEAGREVFARARPDNGLLGGMLEVPGTDWLDDASALPDPDLAAPDGLDWREVGRVAHVFTHFALELRVFTAQAPQGWSHPDGRFVTAEPLTRSGLPTVMKKAVKAAL